VRRTNFEDSKIVNHCEISCSHGSKHGVVATSLTMQAASISETSVNFYQTTRRNNPEESHLRKIVLRIPVPDPVHVELKYITFCCIVYY
jgi:hypothetical protein